jgi:hypothetical protein
MKKLLALLFALLATPAAAQTIPSGPWGSINYWGVGGLSQVLTPGLAGQCLTSQATGSAPIWVNCTVSSLSLLPSINTNQFYGNVSGNFAPPIGVDVNTILNTVGYDIARPPAPESILYKSNVGPLFNWQTLPPGASGSVLTSGGPTNPPFWTANQIQANLAGICTTVGAVLYFDTPSLQWKCLSPGTSGQLLQTGGAAANPSWITGVPTTRNINTTAPLGGGGPLSADLTLTCATCATTTNGGALSATAPITLSSAGNISMPNPLPVANGGTGGATAAAAFNNLAPTINNGHVLANAIGGAATAQDTAPSTWFDAAYCNTVGFLLVRFTGAWTCAKWMAANPVWFGADPTGAADSASALNSALAASSQIEFPVGTFKFNSQISYSIPSGASLRIKGAGVDNTVLNWPSGNGIAVTYGNQFSSIHMSDLTLTSGTTGSNAGVNLALSTGIANPALAAVNSFDHVTLRGSDGYGVTNYWGTGVNVSNVSNINFNDLAFVGSSGHLGNGVILTGNSGGSTFGVQYNFVNSTFNFFNAGIAYQSWIQGVSVSQTNFTNGVIGITVPASQAGSLDQLAVSNSQFNCSTAGISELTDVNSTSITNSLFIVNANSNGVVIDSKGWTVSGNVFAGASATNSNGIVVAATAGSGFGAITGNAFWVLNGGVVLQSGSTGVNVQGDVYTSVTTNVSDSGTSNQVWDAPQGVGSQTTMGASPFTHTAGSHPETDYFNQTATNTAACTKNGHQIAVLQNGVTYYPIQLNPNESWTCTWATTAPTYTPDVH